MYAVYRGPKSKFPEVIFNRAREAKQEVHHNKNYHWGKQSYYKRIILQFSGKIVDLYEHQRIIKN